VATICTHAGQLCKMLVSQLPLLLLLLLLLLLHLSCY
jgi:hypothetical protein